MGSLGAMLLCMPGALFVLASGSAETNDPPIIMQLSAPFLIFMFLDGVGEASADIAMGLASEDITAAEVGLVMLLEIPLGPLFV